MAREIDKKYVYNLPFLERSQLCKMLNQNERWEELAGVWMKFDMMTIDNLRREGNPTDELLTLWSTYNHTILELFILLSKMQHYRAMMILKQFVDSKFHVLIDKGEGNIQQVLGRGRGRGRPHNSKVDTLNYNQITPNGVAETPKVNMDPSTTKIINKVPSNLPEETSSNSNNLLVVSPQNELDQKPQHLANKSNQLIINKTKSTLPQISYEELIRSTDNWNENRILGKGGFGTVYRGTWKNTEVAIKKIECRGPESTENYLIQLNQSLKEITILNSRPHENILPLYAFNICANIPCIVYQFMVNGSLEDRLLLRGDTLPLSWIQRHEIAKGTARGLQYLHTTGDKPWIHGDIKSANILLDKNFEAKIGDFGLAREGLVNDSMKVSRILGTRPYLPDEFLRNKNFSTKIDTYSYGIVLYELATGLKAYDRKRPENKFLKDFIDNWNDSDIIQLMDRKPSLSNDAVFHNLIVLGKWCSNKLAKDRPEMELVFQKLNEL